MQLIYGTPAECMCVSVCVYVCGNSQAHSGTAEEGMLFPLTHLMICLLLCVQRSREITHNSDEQHTRQCFQCRS